MDLSIAERYINTRLEANQYDELWTRVERDSYVEMNGINSVFCFPEKGDAFDLQVNNGYPFLSRANTESCGSTEPYSCVLTGIDAPTPIRILTSFSLMYTHGA